MIAANLSRTLLHATLIFLGVAGSLCMAQPQLDTKVDIGGRRLHIAQSGAGAATVVFESGLGEELATWSDVQPQVARFARTVSYDRAGIGASDPSSQPTTVLGMAADLHALLHAAKIAPPYILVGHSLGGTLVQVFAHAYPAEVAGLVLVDPEAGRLLERLHAHLSAADWDARQKALDEAMGQMPPVVQAEMNALTKNSKTEDEVLPLPKVPVILLSGTKKNPEFPGNPLEQDLKLELHNELLTKIPGAQHVFAPDSRHYIQNDSPQLVIDAIQNVVRRSTPVAGQSANK